MGDIYFLCLSYQIRVSLLVLLSPLPSRVSLYFHGYPILHPRILIFSFYFTLSFPIIFIFEPTDHGYIFRKLVDIKSCPREERHYLIYDIISYKMLYFIIKCALKYLRTSSFVIDFLFMSCHIYFVHHRYLHFAVFFPFVFLSSRFLTIHLCFDIHLLHTSIMTRWVLTMMKKHWPNFMRDHFWIADCLILVISYEYRLLSLLLMKQFEFQLDISQWDVVMIEKICMLSLALT